MKLFNIDNFWPAVALALTLCVVGQAAYSQTAYHATLAQCNLEVTEELEDLNDAVKTVVSRLMQNDPEVAFGIMLFGGIDVFSEIRTDNTIRPQENLDDPSLPINCEVLEYNLNQITPEAINSILNTPIAN